jgi:GNAT superfamily N-acetyltransferase
VSGYRVEPLDPSRVGDLVELASMRTAWTEEGGAAVDDAFLDRLDRWWRREAGHRRIWVARGPEGTGVAMANLQVFERMPRPGSPDARWAYVANVWVDPEHRRRGVGRLVMDEVVAWCRAEGLERMVLNPSEASVPLYRSLGFRAADDLMRLDL